MQIAGDIFSILEDLQNIIQENIENQAHHIQVLLANKLDRCKGKENQLVEEYIKTIQNTYQETHQSTPQPIIVNERKQKEDRVQDEEVFLYKPYIISSKLSRLKTSKPKFIQDKVNNLEKSIVLMQSPVKITLFYSPPHYKTL